MTRPDVADVALLWDMLDACRRVAAYIAGLDEQTFATDDKTQAAVERKVEIIGEAARKVTAPTRAKLPDIAWGAIVGTRHILAHEYARIDHAQLWRIAAEHVPVLAVQLEAALKDHPTRPSASKDPAST